MCRANLIPLIIYTYLLKYFKVKSIYQNFIQLMDLDLFILKVLIQNILLPIRALNLIANTKKAALKLLLIGGGEKI